MSVSDISERKEQPAFVRFERIAVEDKAATLEAGDGTVKYRDVDYVLVTPAYSKDTFRQRAEKWFAQMELEASKGRLPRQWLDLYQESYKRWKRGEEMPLDGTPIKGWPVITPAQQKMLVSLNVLTVESLAAVNDEGLRRMGMGAMELKNKARAWLAQAQDKGPLTIENAKLQNDIAGLRARNEQLEDRVRELAEKVGNMARGGLEAQHFEQPKKEGIAASDILDEPEAQDAPQQPKRRGRPPKQQPSADAPI